MSDHHSTASSKHFIKALAQQAFGKTFWMFTALASVMAVIAWIVLGPAAFQAAFDRNLYTLAVTVPRMIFALAAAGFIWVMLPRDLLSRFIGRNSGLKGLIIATAGGIITPGGPASAFPLLAILGGAGADRGIMIAYITSWAMLGMQRILVWDLPLMGNEFTLVRILVSLPLPIIAGLIARQIPIQIKLREEFVRSVQESSKQAKTSTPTHEPKS